MTITIEAIYENGVFVPAQKPSLADHQQVRLTVEAMDDVAVALEIVRRREGRRIRLDPELARDIFESSDFNLETD